MWHRRQWHRRQRHHLQLKRILEGLELPFRTANTVPTNPGLVRVVGRGLPPVEPPLLLAHPQYFRSGRSRLVGSLRVVSLFDARVLGRTRHRLLQVTVADDVHFSD